MARDERIFFMPGALGSWFDKLTTSDLGMLPNPQLEPARPPPEREHLVPGPDELPDGLGAQEPVRAGDGYPHPRAPYCFS